MTVNRRTFLAGAGVATAGAVGGTMMPGLAKAASVCATPGSTLDDIEHIVILMQENRSFDEYFGRASGVIGFDDPNALAGVFKQNGGSNQTSAISNGVQNGDPGAVAGAVTSPVDTDGYVLPWRMNTKTTDAQSYGGLLHDWPNQHAAWAGGLMNGFLAAQSEDPITMGYYDRDDIPYHYALADAFTICDRYHCSVFGPTNPNRIVFWSGTIDPTGTLGGGPCIENTQSTQTPLMWESFPETLQKAGIDWYLYQENDNYSDNMLPFFKGFQDTTTDLYRRGNGFIPSTNLLGEATALKIKADVLAGRLPQVSYIVGAQETSEHPDATTGRGAQFIDQILDALTSDMNVWAKTLFIVNYDENDGHFDHVLPPTAPASELDENVAGLPVGLGFRVPIFLISPFTGGGLVSSDIFDHTSVIQLLETKFNVRCPNVSAWRRSTVGNLAQAINFAGTPNYTLPTLPSGDQQAADAKAQASLPTPTVPSPQLMPTQETLPVRGRPTGFVPAADGKAATAVNAVAVKAAEAACAVVPGSPAAITNQKVKSLKGATTKEANERIKAKRAARAAPKEPTATLAYTGLDPALGVAGALLAAAGLAAAKTSRRTENTSAAADPSR